MIKVMTFKLDPKLDEIKIDIIMQHLKMYYLRIPNHYFSLIA